MATKKSFKGFIPLLACTSLVALGALGSYVNNNRKAVPDSETNAEREAKPRVSIETNATDSGRQQATQKFAGEKVEVFLAKAGQGDEVTFEGKEMKVANGENPKQFALFESLKGIPVFPKDARILGIDQSGSHLIVQFNDKIEAGYGTDEEATILNCMRKALEQFKDVQTFSLEANGKPLTTLGQFDLSKPIPVRGHWEDPKDEHP